jgi:drug/metabolite transporter (DMT)-like permease
MKRDLDEILPRIHSSKKRDVIPKAGLSKYTSPHHSPGNDLDQTHPSTKYDLLYTTIWPLNRSMPDASRITLGSNPPPQTLANESRWIGAVLCVSSAASYGSTPILGKLGFANGLTLTNMLSLRFGGAALTLFAYLALFQRRTIYPGRRRSLILFLIGAVCYAGNSALFFGALQRVPASLASPTFFIYPVFVALAAWMINRIPPARREWMAIAMAVAGVFLAAGLNSSKNISQFGDATGLDLAMVLGSAILFAAYVISSDRLSREVGAWVSTAWISAGAAVSFGLAGWITGKLDFDLSPTNVWILLGMIVFNTILPLGTFLSGMARIGPTAASLLSTLEPVFTVLLAFALLGERLTLLQSVGIGLVLTAAALLIFSHRRRRPEFIG